MVLPRIAHTGKEVDAAQVSAFLSAGSSDNVNPNLIISAFENRFLSTRQSSERADKNNLQRKSYV